MCPFGVTLADAAHPVRSDISTIAGVAGVDSNAMLFEPFRKRYRQHAVGLLGLAVSGVVIIGPTLELQVADVEIARPVTVKNKGVRTFLILSAGWDR